MSAYSPLKIIHHPDRLAVLRAGGQIVPTQAQIIISDLCNHDCNFCAYRMSGYTSNELFGVVDAEGAVNNNPNRMIPVEKVIEILDDCAAMGVKAIQITGGGEPTVHPQHVQIFNAVVDRGMELAVVSNGAKLAPGADQAFLRATWLRFSLDAAKAETYAKIRRVSAESFERTQRNITRLVNMRMLRTVNQPTTIGIGFVVTQDNWREVGDAIKLAKDLGVDNIRISALFQNDGAAYFAGFYDQVRDVCREAKAKYDDKWFTVFDNFGNRLSDLEQANPDYKQCHYQEWCTYIGADLNVYRCCNVAYSLHGVLGNLKGVRLRTFWESQAKQDAIKSFDARSCARCMFNAQNKTMDYAVNGGAHANFV